MEARHQDVLIVMTRLPREGRNKTRLIPALGPAGAAAMHDRLARHAIGRASSYALMSPGTHLRICVEGGSSPEARAWLGGESDCRIQEDGDLGRRLAAAVDGAFREGARRVVVIGTDCPDVDEPLLAEAFDLLARNDVVFGPANDGGYYLAGLSKPCAALFSGIDWGGPSVLRQSLEAARSAKLQVGLLEARDDVDTPADLPAAEASLAAGCSVSVIVPTLNEESRLACLLARLRRDTPHEILVADGGSTDRTIEIAKELGAKVIAAPRGRAMQMNLAAAAASGEFLLFLHADTMPPLAFPEAVVRSLQAPGVSAGAFRFALDGDFPPAPLIEALVQLRCRLHHTPYGDQGLHLRRRVFRHLGGFPAWPVMEDLEMVRRLKRLGTIHLDESPAPTSARRWQAGGLVRTFLRHQCMIAAYRLGVPPERIARLRH